MLQSHNFVGARGFAARGRFFLYQSSNAASIGADERIAVDVGGQPLGDFYVGDSIEVPAEADAWRVTPYSAGLTGAVLIGNGTVRTNRVAGAVSIIDTGRMATLTGNQFFGNAQKLVASATKMSICGIKAGTKPVSIKGLKLGSDVAQIIYLHSGTGDITDSKVLQSIASNKLLGGASASAQRISGYITTGADIPGAVSLSGINVPAGFDFKDYPLTTPIVIPVGMVMYFDCSVVNSQIQVLFDMEEGA